MAELFPSTLQSLLNEQGFTFDFGQTTIRSDVDVGLAKVRNRFTKAIDNISCTIVLDLDDVATFKAWYKTTLAGGSKTFIYKDPFTQVDSEFRFFSRPQINPMGGRKFMLQMIWETVP